MGFELLDLVAAHGAEQVAFAADGKTGLRAIVAIHSTVLGPGLGGTRFYPFASEQEALVDVLRLAKGMAYKHAACGNDLGGAKAVIKDGLFTRFPKPDFALGMHDEASLPAGVIGFHAGYFRAASTGLDMTVFGKGGHGAFPQATIDPIVIAARIILALQTIVSRENDPADPAVITVGSIHGGTASNIIPEQVKLQITVRSLTPEVHKKLLDAIARQAKGEAAAANAPREPLIETKSHTDAVYNDPELTKRVVAIASAAMGADRVVEMPALMGGEDFSQYGLAGIHAVLLHVGAVDPAKLAESKRSGVPLPGLHSQQWAPEREPTLKAAMTVEVAILMDLFK